jgi:lipid-binding SYLF domain-containing protein
MKNKMIHIILMALFVSVSAQADSNAKLEKKSQDAADIIEEVVRIPEKAIPNSLLEKAVCVATVPNVIKVGFVFGGRIGKGMVSCRVPGGWSQPSFMKVKGGSWGAQFGIQSVDLVLVFVNPNAVERFSKGNFTVGVDASVAAGPIGRDAQAGTDYKLDSEIYSYSKAKGLFAGIVIQGTALTVDKSNNKKVYGDVTTDRILKSDGHRAPALVTTYVNALERYAH